jgi:hypothetical protein
MRRTLSTNESNNIGASIHDVGIVYRERKTRENVFTAGSGIQWRRRAKNINNWKSLGKI